MAKNQLALLLEHFEQEPTITGVEAEAIFKIRHLPSKIFYLKQAGHNIRSETKRDTTGQRYVRYRYLGKKKTSKAK